MARPRPSYCRPKLSKSPRARPLASAQQSKWREGEKKVRHSGSMGMGMGYGCGYGHMDGHGAWGMGLGA